MEKYKEPQICVLNNNEIAEKLQENYIIAEGNLGIIKTIKYEEYVNNRYVNLEYDLAANLHEYEIIIIDLQSDRERKICDKDEEPNNSPYLFQMNYPKTEFDPTPFIMNQIQSQIGKKCLRIIFANSDYSEEYKVVKKVGQNQYSYPDEIIEGIYETIGANVQNKSGKKVKTEGIYLAELVEKYVSSYKVVFELPKIWNAELRKSVLDENYQPLMYNQDGEVISYIGYDGGNEYELLLPVCEQKDKLIQTLFERVLPEVLPTFFPESKEFNWLNNDEFKPIEVLECEKKKYELKKEYQDKIAEIEKHEKELLEKYKFLNDLLVETGDILVEAVCKYFKWLGYEEVILADGQEEILREDIQIIEEKNMYIIEVKGIGGTSTDAECSQIAKHRRKREKENRDKNIIPIYIVNHQRYMQPSLRENPPFSENQIDYAENDERGLLTTWQLYKQFKLIEAGIFTKEETKEALKKVGLITLIPDKLVSLGIIKEYYKKPKAGILYLNNIEIKVGDFIWARKGQIWKKGNIESMQINDNNVDIATEGEVGIVMNIELEKGYELFIKN